MPKAIIFDFRDTLITVKAAYLQANEHLFEELKGLGLTLDIEAYRAKIQPAREQVRATYEQDPKYHDGTSAFIHAMLEVLKFPVPADVFERLVLSYDKKFVESVALYSDAQIVLPRFKAEGLKLGLVIDGTARRERRILERFELTRTFDAVAISEEVGENKLTTKPLWTVLEQLAIPPASVVVVGDREDKDIKNAKLLGCRAVRIVRPGERYANILAPTEADATIRSLMELDQLIRGWTYSHVAVEPARAAV